MCLPELINDIPHLKLTLIGDGKEKVKLEKLVKKLNLSSYVDFKGYIKDPSYYYDMCDVYVSSSKIEELPFNILHVLSFNKVVLAKNIKGNNDIIKDNENRFLYSNKKEFVEKLKFIYKIFKPSIEYINYISLSIDKYRFENVFEENLNLLIQLIKNNLD